jgi:predicted phosphatase
MEKYEGSDKWEVIEGALDGINRLIEKYDVIIFTARYDHDRVSIWLEKNGFPHLRVTSMKPSAMVYIDDHGYHFEDWKNTLFYIERLLGQDERKA